MDYVKIFEQARVALAQRGFRIRDKDIIDVWSSDSFTEIAFTVKSIRGWQFGMWFYDIDGVPMLHFFGMARDGIDKFKPSRAEPMFQFKHSIDEEGEVWWVNTIVRILKMTKHHPIISYNIDMCGGELPYKEPHLICYIRIKAKETKYKIKHWYLNRSKVNPTYIWLHIVKNRLAKLNRYDKIEIIDFNKDDCWCHPRYELRIYYKPNIIVDENSLSATKEWIYSQYKLNGSRVRHNYHIESYQNNKLIGWWYGEPEEQDLIEAFGWKYKVCKYFRKRCNENIEKD